MSCSNDDAALYSIKMSDTRFTGVWINQRGSQLDIAATSGAVYGTFESGVSDAGLPVLVDVQGRAQVEQITFKTSRIRSFT